MDMRNQNDFSDRNTFIYGHNMKVGGEMFSQLNEYASEDFIRRIRISIFTHRTERHGLTRSFLQE